jgi:ribosomal protein S18 acetylase RimI-like enzyme
MTFTIRPMQHADLPGVLAVQAQAYAGAAFEPEGAAVYLDRMALAPALCLVAAGRDGALLGYLVSHPWHDGTPPSLDITLGALPPHARCWYLHDCAVDRRAQGRGIAAALFRAGVDAARAAGMTRAALVAVGSAAGYWLRAGYRPADARGARLSGYGDGACYMTRSPLVDRRPQAVRVSPPASPAPAGPAPRTP